MFTAQVILRPAAPDRAPGPTTSANIADALPDPSTARQAQGFFRGAGFDVGTMLATSFPITAPLERFAAMFGMDSDELEAMTRAPGGGQLVISRLPDDVRQAVEAVVVTAKPDFGPGNP